MKFQPQDDRKWIERRGQHERYRDWPQSRPAKPYNKIFPCFFVSTPKIVYIVHPCVQFWSVGPLVPRAECLSLFLCSGLWMLSQSSSAQNAAACKCDQGIRKTQLIESVFFSIGSHQHVANCFRYLIKEQMSLKWANKAPGCIVACFLTGIIGIFHHQSLLAERAMEGVRSVPSDSYNTGRVWGIKPCAAST